MIFVYKQCLLVLTWYNVRDKMREMKFWHLSLKNLAAFCVLKELTFRNRYKIKTKPYFLWSLLFQNIILNDHKQN